MGSGSGLGASQEQDRGGERKRERERERQRETEIQMLWQLHRAPVSCVRTSIHTYVHTYIYVFIHLSICLCIWVTTYRSIFLSLYTHRDYADAKPETARVRLVCWPAPRRHSAATREPSFSLVAIYRQGPYNNLGAFIIRIRFWGYCTIAIIRKPRGTEK